MPILPESKPPEIPTKTIRLNDFSSGLNTTISATLLEDNELQKAFDASLEQKGTLVPRRGRQKRYASAFSAYPCCGIGAYYKKDGTSRLLIGNHDSLYSDKPHISYSWDTEADWEAEGTTKSTLLETITTAGHLAFKVNGLDRATGNCSDTSKWTAKDVVLTAETSVVKWASSIKIAIATGKTTGYMKVAPTTFDTDKYYVIGAYGRNGDATTGIRIVGLKEDGTVIQGSTYVTATDFTAMQLKLAPADMANLETIGFNVTGTADQYAYAEGVVFMEITSTEYSDAEYVAPTFDQVEPVVQYWDKDSDADWNAGTFTNATTVNNVVTPHIGTAYDKVFDSSVDFNDGTYSGTENLGDVGVHLVIPPVWSSFAAGTKWTDIMTV